MSNIYIYKCIASNGVELHFTPGHFDFTKKYSCFSRKILLLKKFEGFRTRI